MKSTILKPGKILILCLAVSIHSHAQQTSETFIQETHYLLYLPKDYASDTTKQWPLVLFLHGSGESGDDLQKVAAHGPPRLIREGRQFPFIVVSPQTHHDIGWQPEHVKALLEDIKKKYRVDNDRIYLTGLSMGGYGTWATAEKYPEEFAAIVPICGGGDTAKAWKLQYLPIWVFHGAKDNSVPIASSQAMVDAIKPYNPGVKFTIYPDAPHDCWTVTYNNDSLYTWLLAQKRFVYKPITISQKLLNEYAGIYVSKTDTVKIEAAGEGLIGRVGNNSYKLTANTNNSFYLEEHSFNHIEFFRNPKNKLKGFTLFTDERKTFIRQ